MKIIDYNIDHLFDIRIDFNKYPMCKGNFSVLHFLISNGLAVRTILSDSNEVLGIISVILYHKGVAGIFIIPSTNAHDSQKHPFIKAILRLRKELEAIVRTYKLRRVKKLNIYEHKHNR